MKVQVEKQDFVELVVLKPKGMALALMKACYKAWMLVKI